MDTNLMKKCNRSCVIVLILALLEHTLADLKGIATAVDCEPHRPLYEGFIIHSFPWMFSIIPYNTALGFFSHFINLQCTFNWNFVDLFIICMSLYLVSRLEQVNKRIVAVKGRYLPPSFWRTMREDYNRAAHLVKVVDDIIGSVIFISFASNLFFICLQLLHTLADGIKPVPRCRVGVPDKRPLRGYEQAVYFVYSFLFLVARSVAVSLTASRVHTASREPAYALYEVSSETYCIEIQRFLDQIHGDTVSLSGLQFFNVKRGLALTVSMFYY
ncbi:hypothetical protein O3G_MSEX005246 [Manduca sexta]|uniref:Gustatory receptor n=2 Tax=Manduca sexta TaxID=7130 RepID=A0A921YY00_MANSE|nr:hypothetical protein O3G_MSEX005246 [Manduca sexta]KAG6447961.1 hypothetical protein O3G_MSEX005246 [Manduca sexta]